MVDVRWRVLVHSASIGSSTEALLVATDVIINIQRPRACPANPHIPFDKLRVNGIDIENIDLFPFVLSLSKHERGLPDRLPTPAELLKIREGTTVISLLYPLTNLDLVSTLDARK
ncbi:MAG: hypothetical protein WBH61_12880, partial [Candidatus Methylomirabilis sp.]